MAADEGRSLSLAEIAALAGRSESTVTNWPRRYGDFPPLGARTEAEVRTWLAAHRRVAGGPARPVPAGGDDRRLNLSEYARETGRHQSALYQYQRAAAAAGWPERGHRRWFPRPDDEGLYRLGDLVAWDRERPGQGT